jgi:FkbM family methyltransferase
MINAGGLSVEHQQAWYRDGRESDGTRFNFELTPDSVVFDVGGFDGAWTAGLIQHLGFTPHVYIFEPVERYAIGMRHRFAGYPNVFVEDYGLGARDERQIFKLYDAASGMFNERFPVEDGKEIVECVTVNIHDVASVLWCDVDLMSINAEGAEYGILYRLLEAKMLDKVKQVQVQFHNLRPEHANNRHEIQANLKMTHELIYKYPFVWEAWRRK